MQKEEFKKLIEFLDNLKVENFYFKNLISSSVEQVIICTASSERHLKAVFYHLKAQYCDWVRGRTSIKSDWICLLIDGCMLHVMLESTRQYYSLEKLF